MKANLFATLVAFTLSAPVQAATFNFPLVNGLPGTLEVAGPLPSPVELGISLSATGNILPVGGVWQVEIDVSNGGEHHHLLSAFVCNNGRCQGFFDMTDSVLVSDLTRILTISGRVIVENVSDFSGALTFTTPDNISVSLVAVPGPPAGTGFVSLLGLLVWGWLKLRAGAVVPL